MKKIFFIVALSVTAFMQRSFAQDSVKTQPSPLLTKYYNLKDELVGSNSSTAAASAAAFAEAVNDTDTAIVNDELRTALLSNAGAISRAKDLKVQREKFATLSNFMFALVKTVKLSAEPVYQQYCPMKKVSWLSNNKAIKNPYYGNAMLTCGKVTDTIN